jgi:hypothetical protein
MNNQTNSDKFVYAKTLQNTLSETAIRKMAQNVMFTNQSTPTFVQSQLSSIRRRFAENKINSFTTTKRKVSDLRELAKRARLVTAQSVVA